MKQLSHLGTSVVQPLVPRYSLLINYKKSQIKKIDEEGRKKRGYLPVIVCEFDGRLSRAPEPGLSWGLIWGPDLGLSRARG